VTVFKKRVDDWIEVFRNTKPASAHQAVLIPGDPEREAEKIRLKYGIPVIDSVVNDLRQISAKTGVSFEVKH
jgi:LDH2 family malate/lactate/ureidoglycolate dehydrogenase